MRTQVNGALPMDWLGGSSRWEPWEAWVRLGRGQGQLESSPQNSPEAACPLSLATAVLGVGLL